MLEGKVFFEDFSWAPGRIVAIALVYAGKGLLLAAEKERARY